MFWLNLTVTCLSCVYACTSVSCLRPCHYMKIFPTCKGYFFQIHDLPQLTLKTAVRFPWCLHSVSQKKFLNSSCCHEYTFFLSLGWHVGMKGVFIIGGGAAAAKVTSGVLQHLCIFLLLTPSF